MTDIKNGRVVKGSIQAIGSNQNHSVGSVYKNITIVQDNGAIVRIPFIIVPPLADDFFKTGIKGEFYFHTYKKWHTLLAMKLDDLKVFSQDDAKHVFNDYYRKFKLGLFFIAAAIITCVLAIQNKSILWAVMGLLATIYFMYLTYENRVGAYYLPPQKAEKLVLDLGLV